MVVVDTNILAYLYFPSPYSESVERLRRFDNDWIAPILWKSELMNVGLRYLKRDLASFAVLMNAFREAEQAVQSIDIYSDYDSVIRLASQSNCSTYDCEFVALGMKLELPLLTYDKMIIDKFPAVALRPEDYLKIK
jgi:predicted nucleic acid-binding protein